MRDGPPGLPAPLPPSLSARQIAHRLTASLAPGHAPSLYPSTTPDSTGLPEELDAPPPPGETEAGTGLRRAAVLVPVVLGEAPAVMLTLRAATLSAHAGQVALPGGRIAVVALGKAGSREMTAGSVLDLMTLYAAPPEAASEEKGWPAEVFFARFTQRLISALSAHTAEGGL